MPRFVGELPGYRVEGEEVTILSVEHGLGTLDDVQAEVETIAPEDVAHVLTAHDDHFQPGLFRDALEPGGTHLPRRSDCKAIAGNDEVFAAMDAVPEIWHQVSKGTGLPLLVERIQAFRHTISRRRNLIGIDGVPLPGELRSWKTHWI